MGRISLRGVTKRFGATVAVDDLTLEAEDHELLVLLGPSGCGKSTVLRLVAGLDEPDRGEIEIAGRVVNGVEPEARDVAMVFQSYALYPHMDVRRNIAFPLRARRVPRDEQARAVAEAARALGLTNLLDRKPAQLSGGQRQRVALARAIVRQPAAFLMDEPLSNLDAKLRVQTRAELIELQRRLEATVLFVTHDQVEAMTMGHRIAVMNDGRLQQVGPPAEMYDRPANLFVARFLGSPPMNTIRDGEVVIGVRPEHVQLGVTGDIDATVSVVESLGHERHIVCRLTDAEGTMVIARRDMDESVPDVGQHVRLTADPTRIHRFDAATGERVVAA